MLAWLGLVSPSGQEGVIGRALTDSETRLLCDAMVRRFVLPDGELAWSSHMLGTAVTVVGATVEGPPEPLLHSVWDLLAGRELDRSVYEFCRALGTEVRTRYGSETGWDLRWMKPSMLPSHACLRGWILGVKPALWVEIEDTNDEILRDYEFFC